MYDLSLLSADIRQLITSKGVHGVDINSFRTFACVVVYSVFILIVVYNNPYLWQDIDTYSRLAFFVGDRFISAYFFMLP